MNEQADFYSALEKRVLRYRLKLAMPGHTLFLSCDRFSEMYLAGGGCTGSLDASHINLLSNNV